MWSRRGLKLRAKQFIFPNYLTALPVVLLLTLFCLIRVLIYAALIYVIIYRLFSLDGVIVLIVFLAWALIRIFLEGPLVVGAKRFFLNNACGNTDLKLLFSSFNRNEYISNVETMLLSRLCISLWSLLLIVPGIKKFYSYIMVPYIIAENPRIDAKTALKISYVMTYGHKLHIFMLTLSFFWWYLLGFLSFGIGNIFVMPYIEATYTQLYLELRMDIISCLNK